MVSPRASETRRPARHWMSMSRAAAPSGADRMSVSTSVTSGILAAGFEPVQDLSLCLLAPLGAEAHASHVAFCLPAGFLDRPLQAFVAFSFTCSTKLFS